MNDMEGAETIKLNPKLLALVEKASFVCFDWNTYSPLLPISYADLLRKMKGLYALYNNGRCVYVGISVDNVRKRLDAHMKSGKRFDSFKIYPTSESDYNDDTRVIEAIIIYNHPALKYNQANQFISEEIRQAIDSYNNFQFLVI